MELALRMTPAMGAIYDAITDLMDACLKELRRSNKVLRTSLCSNTCLLRILWNHDVDHACMVWLLLVHLQLLGKSR